MFFELGRIACMVRSCVSYYKRLILLCGIFDVHVIIIVITDDDCSHIFHGLEYGNLLLARPAFVWVMVRSAN